MADIDQTATEVLSNDPVEGVGGNAEESVFYEYGDGDSKLTFKTPDELKAHLDKSINFERDYTRKSQARESEYRQRMDEIERQRKEFEASREKWEKEEKSKYDKYNEILSTRPSIAKELERLASNPITPTESFQRAQSYADQKAQELEQRLAKFEEWQQQQELERQTESIYAEMEKEYPGFDKSVIQQALSELDGNNTKQLVEMIWKAKNYDPVKLQEQVEQNIAKKAGSGMVPSGGGPPPKSKGSTDPKIAREEALRDLGG